MSWGKEGSSQNPELLKYLKSSFQQETCIETTKSTILTQGKKAGEKNTATGWDYILDLTSK